MTNFHLCLGGEIKGNRSRDRRKMGRTQIDRLLRELYAARLSGDLNAVCRAFSPDAVFRIASASEANPVTIEAVGIDEFRPLLAFMIKTFKLADLNICTMDIGDAHVKVHWRANIRPRNTGATVLTELIDLIDVRDGRIVNFIEVFVPR
ncbi:nuclear transport factor 2 family protein [Candidatus Binatus sp.]|uniref:nuclear transport factor 2 family protein n=1 Tax=Candidatus Binatus sp. TaxID=2811406 RepID=UPI003C76E9CD